MRYPVSSISVLNTEEQLETFQIISEKMPGQRKLVASELSSCSLLLQEHHPSFQKRRRKHTRPDRPGRGRRHFQPRSVEPPARWTTQPAQPGGAHWPQAHPVKFCPGLLAHVMYVPCAHMRVQTASLGSTAIPSIRSPGLQRTKNVSSVPTI